VEEEEAQQCGEVASLVTWAEAGEDGGRSDEEVLAIWSGRMCEGEGMFYSILNKG
jgi:hypothetical protein